MVSTSLPDDLFCSEQVQGCINTFGPSMALVYLAPMDFAQRLDLYPRLREPQNCGGYVTDGRTCAIGSHMSKPRMGHGLDILL